MHAGVKLKQKDGKTHCICKRATALARKGDVIGGMRPCSSLLTNNSHKVPTGSEWQTVDANSLKKGKTQYFSAFSEQKEKTSNHPSINNNPFAYT